ncbi:MAG: sortase [Actinomycetota bacterium]|nr:sortase [Actinomycetota bacterium]
MRWLRLFGKFLISVGFGVLLFVGWTLWGTGLYTAQQQDVLDDQFATAPTIPLERTDGKVEVPGDFAPGPGKGVFRLRIPAIDFSQMVVEGVGTEDLRKGPGHFPSCRRGFERPLCTDLDEVWPGEEGRAIISGHRTTYGAPFYNLDRLENGDKIITETKWGDFTYEVTDKEIVPPDSTDIANPAAATFAEIVLTTCNPRFSAAQRLIVYARMTE